MLFAGETEIGRRSDNGISLPVLSVSKRHAKVSKRDHVFLLVVLKVLLSRLMLVRMEEFRSLIWVICFPEILSSVLIRLSLCKGSSNKTRLFASGSSSGSAVVLKPNEAYPVSSGAEFLFGEIRCLLTIFSESQARESAYE